MSEENQIECGRVFPSMQTLAEHLGVSKSLLSICKRKGAPGFTVSGRIYWDQLEPWFNAHRAEIEADQQDTLTKWKTRKTKADAQIAELELEEMREKYLDKDEVQAFLKQISTAQMALLKSKLTQELPPKLLGLGVTDMEVQMTQVLNDVCKIFQDEISKWQ